MYFLYMKIHNVTGLKYLGQTTRDPYKYKGSGLRWNNHLNKHGNDVTTVILLETNDRQTLSSTGEILSNYLNIVTDYSWANIVNEEGTGGDTSHCDNYQKSLVLREYGPRSKEVKQKISNSLKDTWKSKEQTSDFKAMCSLRSKKMWENRGILESDRITRSKLQKQFMNDITNRKNVSDRLKEYWKTKSKTYEVIDPRGTKHIVKSLSSWCKEHNYPYFKIRNTIVKNRPSLDGWKARILDE